MAVASHTYHSLSSGFKYFFAMDETYYDISRELLRSEQYEFDLSMLYFRGVDILSHCAMHYSHLVNDPEISTEERARYGDVVKNYYIYTDTRLAELLEVLPEGTNILIMSDHDVCALR